MVNKESFLGCFFGLALGDALCASYEGGVPEKTLWLLIGKTRTGKKRYTDDTQMSLDVAKSLLEKNGIDQNHLSKTFASSYRWSRGYGIGASKMLRKIKNGAKWQEVNRSIYSQGSYGNGAAMRAPVVALYFYGKDNKLATAIEKVSEITHVHPLAIEGATLIALSTSFALSRSNFGELFNKLLENSKFKEYQIRIEIANTWIENNAAVDSKTVSRKLGNGIAATESCVTAIYIASRYINLPFSNMLNFIKKCSGDTDTIGAMAGAIWGAYNGLGGLSQSDIEKLESASKVEQLSIELYDKFLTI